MMKLALGIVFGFLAGMVAGLVLADLRPLKSMLFR